MGGFCAPTFKSWKRQREKNILEIPSEGSIRHSIGIKYNIVSSDPEERGYRKVLNFGHTIGHAIEGILSHELQQKVTHGDCVALGMLAEAQLSHKYADMKKSDLKNICDYLTLHYEKIDLNGVTREAFFNSLMQDKKNRGEEIRATLIRKPGDCVIDIPVSLKACWKALKFYENLYYI